MTTKPLRLMCILAHPDDESLGIGGVLAKYAAEGIETYLVTATRGERGWFGDPADYPGPQALGQIREAELRAAAEALGLREVSFLDYQDGDLDQAEPAEVIAQIVSHLRRIRPQVVITFDPYGLYGHPDHIAISQFTTAAVAAAANIGYSGAASGLPHQVLKLYYRIFTQAEQAAHQAVFGEVAMHIDGDTRRLVTWPDWAMTTSVDASAYWPQVWQAVACHRSQLPDYQTLAALPDEVHRNLWGNQFYYRALSLVNGGRNLETDLFAGIQTQNRPQPLRLPMFAI